jgi:membrane protein YdbS with pleckstrin-like domain
MKQDLVDVPIASESATFVHPPAEDLGTTQRGMEPLAADRRIEPLIPVDSVRPSILRYLLWATMLAVAALLVNRSPAFVPASVASHWPQSAAALMSAVIAVLAVMTLVYGYVERARHRYTIDEHAVTIESGMVAHHRDAIPLPAIINLQLHQSPLSRLLNLGTIVLTTVRVPGHGPATLELHDVAHASNVYDAIIRRVGAGGNRVRFEAGDPALEDLTS